MNFLKEKDPDMIKKKAKEKCSECFGYGSIIVKDEETGRNTLVDCPKCTAIDAEIIPEIDAKSAEILPEIPETATLSDITEPKIFVENGKQVKDQVDKIGLHFVLKDMPDAILECGKVMQNGYKKYPIRRGWLDVPADDVDGAICRHSNAYFRGEKIDPESKCYHLAHLAINALMNLQKELETQCQENT